MVGCGWRRRAATQKEFGQGVLANMLALWPDDLAIQNDEAYSRLLLCPPAAMETKRQAATIEKLAEKLIQREPQSLPHRTLLALALLRQERAEDALRVYSQLQVGGILQVSGSALAVHHRHFGCYSECGKRQNRSCAAQARTTSSRRTSAC